MSILRAVFDGEGRVPWHGEQRNRLEFCMVCHGRGREFAVDKMHRKGRE